MRAAPKPVALEILHDLVPGRIRYRNRAIVGREALARAVEKALVHTRGVAYAKASPLTGSIVVEFQAPAAAERIADIIEAVIAGRPPPRPPHPHT